MARYGTPGTSELGASIEPYVQGHDAILMANHGVVTYGPDLLTAFLRMETTEHFAQVSLVTERLGKKGSAFRIGCGETRCRARSLLRRRATGSSAQRAKTPRIADNTETAKCHADAGGNSKV